MSEEQPITTDIEVLREMVRLAEKRRDEEFHRMEKLNTYNLALIAFAGSFLSLLVSIQFDVVVVQISGALLIISILSSLLAIRPRTIHGGTVVIDSDVRAVRNGERLSQQLYLLDTADLTEGAARSMAQSASQKTRLTIISAILLACALLAAYTLVAYATP